MMKIQNEESLQRCNETERRNVIKLHKIIYFCQSYISASSTLVIYKITELEHLLMSLYFFYFFNFFFEETAEVRENPLSTFEASQNFVLIYFYFQASFAEQQQQKKSLNQNAAARLSPSIFYFILFFLSFPFSTSFIPHRIVFASSFHSF